MMKKVLFALIALFSFVSTWAYDDVVVNDVDGYDVTLRAPRDQYDNTLIGKSGAEGETNTAYVLFDFSQGKAPTPEVQEVAPVGEEDALDPTEYTVSPDIYYYDGTKLVKATKLNEVRTYYRLVSLFEEGLPKNLLVPFQVWKVVSEGDVQQPMVPALFLPATPAATYEFINNRYAFEWSVEAGALADYYEEWGSDAGVRAQDYDGEEPSWFKAASQTAQKYVNGVGFPWIAFKSTESVPCRVLFEYSDLSAQVTTWKYPWASKHAQGIFFSTLEDGKKYGIASVNDPDIDYQFGQVYADPEAEGTDDTWAALGECSFQTNRFTMYFTPKTDPEINFEDLNIYFDEEGVTYAGTETGEMCEQLAIGLPADYEVVGYEFAGAETAAAATGANLKDYPNRVGYWYMYITSSEGYGVSQAFEVTPAELAVNLGGAEMYYGDDYPLLAKKNYTVSGYQAGDNANFIVLEGLGHVQPLHDYADANGLIPVGTNYQYSAEGHLDAIAWDRRFGAEKVQNYYVVVHNMSAVLTVKAGKYDVIVLNPTKVYGDDDPSFKFVVKNTSGIIVGGNATEEEVEAAFGLTDFAYPEEKPEAIAAGEALKLYRFTQIEATDIVRAAGEDVAANGYKFSDISNNEEGVKNWTATVKGLASAYVVPDDLLALDTDPLKYQAPEATITAGNFYIYPYDITPDPEPEPTPGPDPDPTPVPTPNDFVVNPIDAVEYAFAELEPVPTAYFETEDNVLTGAKKGAEGADAADFVYGDYANNFHVWNEANAEALAPQTEGASLWVYGQNNFAGSRKVTFEITPATLTATPDPDALTKVYDGNEVGEIAAVVTGWKGDPAETAEQAIAYVAPKFIVENDGSDVGTYTVVHDADNPGSANDYVFVYDEGQDYTITEKTLWVVAGDVEISMDQKDDYEDYLYYTVYDADPSTLDANELAAHVVDIEFTTEPTLAIDPTAIVYTTRTYDIIPSDAAADNYTFEYVNGTLTLTDGYEGLVIAADDQTCVYGAAVPTFTYKVTLFDEDITSTLTDEEKALIETYCPDFSSNAGEYAIKLKFDGKTGETADDEITTSLRGFIPVLVPGTLTITPATMFVQVVVASADGVQYGDQIVQTVVEGQAPNQTVNYGTFKLAEWLNPESGRSGLVDGDDFDQVIDEMFISYGGVTYVVNGGEAADNAGTYSVTIDPNNKRTKNYILVCQPSEFERAKASVDIALNSLTKDYSDYVIGEAYVVEPVVVAANNTNITVTGATITDDELADLFTISYEGGTKIGAHDLVITPTAAAATSNYNFTINNEPAATITYNPLNEIRLSKDNVAQALEDHKGIEMEKVFLADRRIKEDQWYAMVLPFAFDVPEFFLKSEGEGDEYSGLYFGSVARLDQDNTSGSVSFKATVANVPANEPFLFQLAKDPALTEQTEAKTAVQMSKVYVKNVTIGDSPVPAGEEGYFAYNDVDNQPKVSDGKNDFIGTYVITQKADGFKYTKTSFVESEAFVSRGNGKFYKGDTDANKAHKLYVTDAYVSKVDGSSYAGVRFIIENEEGAVTAIEGIGDSADDADASANGFAEGWYTINGIKLEGEPTVSGTYIFNGKKVFVQK